uniref:Uncharacterized protein n=1 Tax=Pelusios castaneus TaxID=367368 RepID=A0A8C8RFL3_9SAUR
MAGGCRSMCGVEELVLGAIELRVLCSRWRLVLPTAGPWIPAVPARKRDSALLFPLTPQGPCQHLPPSFLIPLLCPQRPTCYANLKMMKAQGQQLPDSSVGGVEIQYTDVVTGPRWSEPEIWGGGPQKGREATRPQSELYASVHTDRYKTEFANQDYANNHAVPS